MDTCANCGRKIGALEQAHVLGESVVCSQCLAILQTPPVTPPPAQAVPPHQDLPATAGDARIAAL